MSLRKYFTFTNFMIALCIIFIAILMIITVPILINWIFNPNSVTDVPSNIASTSTALIVVLISIITLLVTKKQTNESLKQTERTIKDNEIFNTESLKKNRYNDKRQQKIQQKKH